MLGVIIGAVLLVIGIVLYKLDLVTNGCGGTISIVGVLVIVVSLFFPGAGYDEPELINEVQLNSFYEQGGKEIFAIDLDYGEVAITYTEKEYVYGNELEILHAEAVYAKIAESENCTKPVKQIYRSKPKVNLFFCGKGIKMEEAIIVVPEGSVRK